MTSLSGAPHKPTVCPKNRVRYTGANCNIEATPAADSTSCKDDAVVTMAESDNILTVRREGRAELTLASNPHDSVGTSRSLSVVK
jgi:hypothetical protein